MHFMTDNKRLEMECIEIYDIDYISALDLLLAWSCQAASQYLIQCWHSSVTPCATSNSLYYIPNELMAACQYTFYSVVNFFIYENLS